MSDPALKRTINSPYAEVLERIAPALATEGFGILTTIDVAATLKKKIDVDFRPYTILGACNPPFAHRALQADLHAGLMMPCNVVVYSRDDGKTDIVAVDPMDSVASLGAPDLIALAKEVRAKMALALEKI
jgi:uncharacterized protein (DUF302 family)